MNNLSAANRAGNDVQGTLTDCAGVLRDGVAALGRAIEAEAERARDRGQ